MEKKITILLGALIICFLNVHEPLAQGNTTVETVVVSAVKMENIHTDVTFKNMLLANPEVKPEDFIYYTSQLEKIIEKNSARKLRIKSDEKFLKRLYHSIHQEYFKTYKEYTTFDEIFSKGTYNCVSGTLIYAYLLDYWGYDYSIYETLRHVYLVVHLDEKDILLEPTMLSYGFITKASEIARQEADYQLQHKNNFKIKIDIQKLIGLQLYNNGAEAFGKFDYTSASFWLNQAYSYYPCERVTSLFKTTQQYIKEQNPFYQQITYISY